LLQHKTWQQQILLPKVRLVISYVNQKKILYRMQHNFRKMLKDECSP